MVFLSTLYIYCTLKALETGINPLIYPIFPAFGFFCILLIVVFYPYITKWESKSQDFIVSIMSEVRAMGGVESAGEEFSP